MNPLKLFEECANTYGEPFTLEVRKGTPYVVIYNPDAIKDLFSNDHQTCNASRGNHLLLPLVGETSIFLQDGNDHARQKKLMFPSFHGKSIQHYGEIMVQSTHRVTQKWQWDKPFRMRESMQEITLDVIMQTVFGISDKTRYAQLKTRLANLLELIGGSPVRSSLLFFPALQKDFPGSPWRNLKRRHQFIHDLLQAEIQQQRENNEQWGNDILSLLMSARDEDGNPMSDSELRNQLITLLIAGNETTATALAWAFYWIHRFREVRNNLLDELATINDTSDIKTLNQLPYLDAVCNETLRIYPVAIIPFLRTTQVALTVGNYQYPANTFIVPCIYLLHHREDIYPHSKQFKPERFLERDFSPYEFMPFGGGNRRCLGDTFAPMEMKIVLATILKQYELTLLENEPITPVRRGVTIAPKGGVKMALNN